MVAGCAPRTPWVGEWEGKRDLARPEGMDAAIHGTLAKVRLTLREDGSFLLVEAGVPREGDATLSGETATLYARRILGRPVSALGLSAVQMNKPMRLRWLGGDRIEYTDPGGFDTRPVELRRRVRSD